MPDALSHLLVPTDFRSVSRAATQLALEMAYGWRARVTLLHVIPEEPLEGLDAIGYLHRALWASNHPWGFMPVYSNHSTCERVVRARLERGLHPEWRRDLNIHVDVRRGEVAAEVARFALEVAADLIVVGVNRPGWRLSFRPRLSDRIVRLTGRPVVLVHPGRSAPRPKAIAQPSQHKPERSFLWRKS